MTKRELIILLVDDEPDILEIFSNNLKREGYNVYTAEDGLDGLQKAKKYKPHLIVLDLMMPVIDGIELCEQIRSTDTLNNSAIVIVTARSDDYSQIAGYKAGADDYIIKPVKIKVFMHKINALLKRYNPDYFNTHPDSTAGKIEHTDLEIDIEKFSVTVDGKSVFLPKKEFNLLLLLASKPGKVFTRENIYNHIWGYNIIVSERSIDVHIRKLREKIGDDRIITVKGVGYKYREHQERELAIFLEN